LLNIIGLLDYPSAGNVEIDNTPVKEYPDKLLARLRNSKLGFIFQSYHLINDLTVADNVELPMLYRKSMRVQKDAKGQSKPGKSGVGCPYQAFPSQLSGGQRQRVAIARALWEILNYTSR
jgi:putative ABC transport system ATP-binding protein